MFHVVQRETITSDFITDPVEEPGILPDGSLKPQFDDSMNDRIIININPERKFLRPFPERVEVETLEPPGKTSISFKRFRTPHGSITNRTLIEIDELGLEIRHGQGEGNIDRLIRRRGQ